LNALRAPLGLPRLRGGLVVGLDRDPNAKVTFILFDDAGRPQVIAKVARQASAEQALLAEHAMLLGLESARLRKTAGQLPKPVLMERIGGRVVLATTVLPGSPLTVRYYTPRHLQHPRRVAEDLRLAGSWLACFQQETRSGVVVLGAEAFDVWVRPTFARYRETVGWSDWEQRLLDQLAWLANDFSGVSVPLVSVHGDYAIGNLLVGHGQISGVIDWEFGRQVGTPFSDLFKFAGSYGSYLDRTVPPTRGMVPGHPGWAAARARWGTFAGWTNAIGFLYAYFGRGWFPDLVRSFLLEHLERLQVPPSAGALFLPVFVAEQVMALDDPVYRNGYRALLQALWQEGDARWLTRLEAAQ
jgi:aminoglycoside phosphotransferase